MATEVSFSEDHELVSALEAKRSHDHSFLDLLIVLADRKRTILWITAAFLVASILISFLLPQRYTASATLLPPQQNTSLSSILMTQLGALGNMASLAGGSLGLKNPNDMFVAMLRSRTVEEGMVKDFKLMEEYHTARMSDAEKAFEGHSKVDGNGKDGMIHISVDDRDPKRAAELANGYVDEFRHLSEHLALTEAQQRRAFFEKQLEQAKNNLADAEEALKKTQTETGLIQLDSQSRALIASAETLRGQIAAKEVELSALQTYATDQNAQVIQTEQELTSLRGLLQKLGGSESAADSLIVPKGKVPEAGLEYVRKLRDVKYYETIFELLARQFEIAKLDEAKEGSVIQVVDEASMPDRRSFPKRGLIVAGATILGFMIGVFVALFSARMARLKQDEEAAGKLRRFRRTLFGIR
jgi:uncharacterized protein involved in exopolysaccharide biosynthesis